MNETDRIQTESLLNQAMELIKKQEASAMRNIVWGRLEGALRQLNPALDRQTLPLGMKPTSNIGEVISKSGTRNSGGCRGCSRNSNRNRS